MLPHDGIHWGTCGLSREQCFVLTASSQVHAISICAISVHSHHSVEVPFVTVLQANVILFLYQLEGILWSSTLKLHKRPLLHPTLFFCLFLSCGIIASCRMRWVIACLSLFPMFRLFWIQPGGAHSSRFLCPFALISLFFGRFLVFLLEAHLALFLIWSWNPAFLQGVPLLQMLSSALSPMPHSGSQSHTDQMSSSHHLFLLSLCWTVLALLGF